MAKNNRSNKRKQRRTQRQNFQNPDRKVTRKFLQDKPQVSTPEDRTSGQFETRDR